VIKCECKKAAENPRYIAAKVYTKHLLVLIDNLLFSGSKSSEELTEIKKSE
jgi:hypothetical protein